MNRKEDRWKRLSGFKITKTPLTVEIKAISQVFMVIVEMKLRGKQISELPKRDLARSRKKTYLKARPLLEERSK